MSEILIECLHIDDEMWSIKSSPAYTIRSLFREAVGDGKSWDEPRPSFGVETVTLDPLSLRADFHLNGTATSLQLTQTSSFREADRLLDERFYQLVIADAVNLSDEREVPDERDFLSYGGSRLLRKARGCSEQRLIYSAHFEALHGQREVDLVAGDLGAFVTDHPFSAKTKSQFRDRVQRMVKGALLNPSMGGCRTFARLTRSDDPDEVDLEILELTAGGWRTLVRKFPLTGVRKGSGSNVGPAFAEYATFLWYLGYSRGRQVSHHDFPMPRAWPGTGSWVRALTSLHRKLVEHRNTELFPDDREFREAIDAEEGFWPRSRRWSEGPRRAEDRGRIPRLRLNLMTPVPRVHRDWMPSYKEEKKRSGKFGGEFVRDWKPFTREIIRPVLPYLPGGGDALFPLSDDEAFDD